MMEEDEDDPRLLFDERVAARRIAFRNAQIHPTTLTLHLDHTAESLTSLGSPPWLRGTFYLLVPAIFDIHYWQGHYTLAGRVMRRETRSLEYLEDCPRMLVQVEFGNGGMDGVVQYKSQLLHRGAVEVWRRVQGIKEYLDERRISCTLGGVRKTSWLETIMRPFNVVNFTNDIPNAESTVVGETIMTTFPMGKYHGEDTKLVVHQTGMRTIQTIDPLSLRPKRNLVYAQLDERFVGIPCSRPLVDLHNGELINVLIDYHSGPRNSSYRWAKYLVVSITTGANPSGVYGAEHQLIASFLAPPIKLECFALTANFVIVVIHPYTYISRLSRRPIVSGIEEYLRFNRRDDTLFYVVSRKEKRLGAVWRSEASYVASIVNAFEGENSLFVDVVAGEEPDPTVKVESLRRRHVVQVENQTDRVQQAKSLRRYCLFKVNEEMARFDGAAGQLAQFPLAPFHLLTEYELVAPHVPNASIGRPYRFAYGLAVDRENRGKPGYLSNALIKCDVEIPSKSMQWHREGLIAGPPVFIPRGELAYGQESNDDGVLMMVVLDVEAVRSWLMVLDARDLRELARYLMPTALSLAVSSPAWSPTIRGVTNVSLAERAIFPITREH